MGNGAGSSMRVGTRAIRLVPPSARSMGSAGFDESRSAAGDAGTIIEAPGIDSLDSVVVRDSECWRATSSTRRIAASRSGVDAGGVAGRGVSGGDKGVGIVGPPGGSLVAFPLSAAGMSNGGVTVWSAVGSFGDGLSSAGKSGS
jgi:hypothetical protein